MPNYQSMKYTKAQPIRAWEYQETLQNAVTANGDGTEIDTLGSSVGTVQIAGTFDATVTFEVTVDKTNWVAVRAVNKNTGGLSSTATAAGIYLVPLDGARQLRTRVSSYVSGTVTSTVVLVSVASGMSTVTATLSDFAATTSAELAGVISDETGTGALMFATSPVITTDITIPNTGLHILDTNASHDLIIAPGSDLTADRTLTLTTGDAARTITLSGNPTLADWFDQSVKQAASPTFAGLDLTEGNITNVGDISLDSLTSDGSTITIGGTPSIVLTDGTTVAVTLGNDAGDDFTIDTSAFVVEGDTGNVGIGTTSPSEILHIESATDPTLVITNADANQSDGGKISFREANAIERFNIEYDGSTNRLKFVSENVGDVLVMEKATGSVLIGDTANANMTQGLTINQGANDDEIFALKSSDVAHGVTDFAETDTFALFKKAIPTQGGFQFWSFMETGQNGAIQLIGVDTDDNTSKTSGARAPVEAYAYKKSGTSVGALGANANAFVIRDAGGAIFLVDEDGDYHYDGADGGAFDHMNDVQLTRAFSLATSRDVIRTGFDDFVQYNERDLIEAGILGAPVADGGLVNGAQLQRLHTGAIWQLGTSQMQLEQRIEQLETALLDAGMEIPQLQ